MMYLKINGCKITCKNKKWTVKKGSKIVGIAEKYTEARKIARTQSVDELEKIQVQKKVITKMLGEDVVTNVIEPPEEFDTEEVPIERIGDVLGERIIFTANIPESAINPRLVYEIKRVTKINLAKRLT